MKRIILAFLLFVFCLGNVIYAEPVNLDRKFKLGQVDKYSYVIEITIHLPSFGGKQMPPIDASMNSIMVNKVTLVNADGSAKIKSYLSPPKINVSNVKDAAKKTPKMQAITLYYTVSKDGKLMSIEGFDKSISKEAASMDIKKMLNQMPCTFSLFPGKPVELGETWNNKFPIPIIGSEITLSSTYASDNETYNQLPAYKLKQTFDANIDLVKIIEIALQNMKIKNLDATKSLQGFSGNLSMVGYCENLFSKVTGTLFLTNGKMTIKLIMKMPETAAKQGMPANMEINMDMGFRMNKI